MTDNVEKYTISQFTEEVPNIIEDLVTREVPLTIILNNQELVTLLCSPANLDCLAIGFLFAEGLISNKSEIKKITIDGQRGVIRISTEEGTEFAHELLFKRLITSACGRGAAFYTAADAQHPSKIESQIVISPKEVYSLVEKFSYHSQVFKTTGGVHSAALSDIHNILVFYDDLGRHNAIDKVFGHCILTGIPTEDHVVLTSGRTPSEMVLKVAKGKVPILISISAPTDLGVRLANDLGVTLIGFVRNKRMNVYTNGWRVVTDGR